MCELLSIQLQSSLCVRNCFAFHLYMFRTPVLNIATLGLVLQNVGAASQSNICVLLMLQHTIVCMAACFSPR